MRTFLIRAARYRVEIALALCALAVLGPIVARNSAQPASRMALTAALAEHGTVDITGYPVGVDRALYDGHPRSDKAPGQPVLAVPVYLVARAAGFESAARLRVDGNLTLWWVAFWTSIVPFAILLVLMYRAALRVAPAHAVPAALAVGFGGMLVPFAAHLFGHVLGATCVFGGWFVLEPDPNDRRRLLGAGALLGAAVFVEYQAAVVVAAVVVYALLRAGRRGGWLFLGGAPFALALGWYQWRAFGAPWRLPFTYYAGTINGTSDGGYSLPGVHGFADVILGSHGLLQNAPLVLLGIAAAGVLVWNGARRARVNGLLALAVCGALIVMVAGWSGTPTNEVPGPRYLAPAIPFLAVPVAALWYRYGRAFTVAAVVGCAVGLAGAFSTIVIASQLAPWRGISASVAFVAVADRVVAGVRTGWCAPVCRTRCRRVLAPWTSRASDPRA